MSTSSCDTTAKIPLKFIIMRLLFILSLIAAVSGSSITNGTCYWKAGEEADVIYSPCGNTIDGNWPCCQLGDKCNDYNTCTWDSGRGIFYTYVAGCTDPNYEDDHCPFKGNFSDYQWVGLAWDGCKTTGSKVDWYGCKNDGYPRVRMSTESENCKCDAVDQPLLEQAPTGLDAMGYLPSSKMGEITWEPGWSRTDSVMSTTATGTGSSFSTRTLAPATSLDTATTPSSSRAGGATATDSRGSTITTNNTVATSAAPATDSTNGKSSSIMNTGTKVGLGIGFAAVGLIAGLLCLAFVFKHRKKDAQNKQETIKDYKPQDQVKVVPHFPSEPAILDAGSIQRDSTWSGQKSELPGSPPNPFINDTISPISTVPMRNDDHVIVYKPFRYQSADMGGITELPQEERPSWSGVDYAAYKAEEARDEARQVSRGGRDNQGGSGNFHELPG